MAESEWKNGWNWSPDHFEFIVSLSPLRWRLPWINLFEMYLMIDFGPINIQIGLPLWYERNM